MSPRRSRRSAFRASLLAMSVLGAGNAFAQCVPNPSQTGQAITCTGTQSGGYTIATDQSPLTVTTGSSIQNSGDALTVSIPASIYNYYYNQARTATVTVQGSIASTSGSGISISSGPPYPNSYDFGGTYGSISVAAGGSISGVTGITLAQYPSYLSYFAAANVSLDNAGAITGTGGSALVSSGNYAAFSTITNEAGASLGSVAASFGTLTNNGTIDGGSASAIAPPSSYYFQDRITNNKAIKAEGAAATILLNGSGVTNSGTITNTGTGAAVANAGSITNQATGSIAAFGADVITGTYVLLSNYGTVVNLGAGQAVSGTGVNITNYTGATISGGSGGTAINGTNSLYLINSGTINGNVLAGSSSSSYQTSFVDSSLGTINGSLTFGAGQNTLVASLSNGALQTGITGAITGGTGAGTTNTLEVTTTSDATLSSAAALPTNFTQLEFVPGSGTTLTLGNGFTTNSTIIDNGPGTLTNTTTLSGSGQIVSMGFNAGTFSNAGLITSSNLGGQAAISFSGYAILQNSGTITASGDGVSGFGDGVTNSGTISAGGTAVSVYVNSGTFSNSGTISSSGGTAVSLMQSCSCSSSSNTGTISGALVGVQLSDGILNNSGTITSPGYGVALQYYGTVNNLSGGVITGGSVAIGNPNGSVGISSVSNAGTINGNVNLANSGFGTNTYDAAPGGVLNGNLTLGVGDTLITDLVNPGSSSFAGITGTVSANNSILVYNVGADATMPSTTPAGFSSVGYQLFNNPTLTMAANSTSTATLDLAGTGAVELNGTIATSDAIAVYSQGLRAATGYVTSGATALAITNTGAISTAITIPNYAVNASVTLGSNSLVNSGSISLTDTTGNTNPYLIEAAVAGKSITNTGTITGTGAGAVALGGYYNYPQTVSKLTNSGTLTSNATTVQIEGAATINNTGTIASTGQAAIGEPGFFYNTGAIQINNQAGGTITGSTDAIDLQGGTVSNAGTINGNVNLNSSSYYYTTGTYYDNGGTLNGNLSLNANGALAIDLANQGSGPLGGVTGTINANGASLIYDVNASATTSGARTASGFGQTGYLLANNSTLTFASGSQQTRTVAVAGTGSVILNGTISTSDAAGLVTQPQGLLTATGIAGGNNALTITNNGTIVVTADASWSTPVAVSLGGIDTLINNGTIILADSVVPYANYIYATVNGGGAITNTGTIAATNLSAVASYNGLTNSGTITSNVVAVLANGSSSITNSGTITSTGAAAISGGYYNSYSNPPMITNSTGGVISGSVDAIDLVSGTVVNAGTINGNVNLAAPYYYYYGLYGSGGYYDNGGTLNGNLTLTRGQVLLVDYGANTGPLGGVTGTINANGATLLYNIGSDTTVTPPSAHDGFGSVGYQFANNATLTIPTAAALTSTLTLAGTGSVVLNGTITTFDQVAVQSIAPLVLINSNTGTTLSITNNGTIAATTDNPHNLGYAAVSLGTADSLVNNGSISLTNSASFPYSYDAAVSGGKSVTNNGSITGTGVSAVAAYGSGAPETLNNSGTITSDQFGVLVSGPVTLTNSGTITSTGMTAIGNYGYYFSNLGAAAVANLAGGTITGVGDAIDLVGGIVSNAGTINGNVNLAYSPYGYYGYYASGAYINAGGTLNGNLTLGITQALVTPLGSYNGTGFVGITGTVNANGATLLYNVGSDTTVTSPPAPSGFGSVGYQFANNATLTIPTAAALTSTLTLAGTGSVVLNGTITTFDQVAVQSISPFALINSNTNTALAISNNGTIATTTDNPYVIGGDAVSLGTADTLVNNGTISLTNTAGFNASSKTAVLGGLSLTNTGTISGSGASAVEVGPLYYNGQPATTLINTGTIASDQYGVLVSGPVTITNSGTIASSGLAAIANANATYGYSSIGTKIANLAGGSITGTGDAIELQGGIISNAGTINGNVNLAYPEIYNYGYASGAYINAGGTLNGNLTLGLFQELVTPLGSYNGAGFSGITGTVNASSATVIYTVGSNATTSVVAPTGFANVGYQLSNNATLTLTADSLPNNTLALSGTGSVNLGSAITTTDIPAIYSAPIATASGPVPANALTITSTGALATTLDTYVYYYNGYSGANFGTVVLGAADSFINEGSVTFTNGGVPAPTNAAAVNGGQSLVNTGTITATGAAAVSLGSNISTAPLTLTNSGSISSDQTAVVLNGPATVTNSGTIASSTGVAIINAGPGATQLTNITSGVISGATDAIDIAGGLVNNAGTITGNVNLGYAATNVPNATPGVYIASGGTLAGNLIFSSTNGGNELVETSSGFGVSGSITSGPGTNYLGHLRSAGGPVTLGGTLPSGFATEYTVALGAGTQVTLQGPADSKANIYVGGNAAIVNQANTSGIIEDLGASGESYFASQGLQLASLTNMANVGGITISAANLVNSGTVGSPNATGTAITQTSSAALSFINSGTINGSVAIDAANYTVIDASGGTITGNIAIQPAQGGIASGSITLAGGFAGSIDGGAGATTSLALSGGDAAQPIAFGNIANIDSYSQSGGYATLSGTASLGTAGINGGTFVGLVGSIFNASQINVASGATFASGGSINGNLAVSGTLHVGASPDTMTVNGNVTLASGSTSVFEVSPTVSSKLVASGTVAIGSNTTLQIVQLQPLMPGTSIDLIHASGGITGDFATITGINGAIVEKGDDLSLIALFDATRAANPQVSRGVTYLNTLIQNGGASPALLATLPALQTAGGAPATGAFSRLTPEAYASATQIGVENGLMLSRAMRELGLDGALHSGNVFSFGQALGNWRGISGNAGLGTSHADLSGYGYIGGLGMGSASASIAVFGGFLDQTEDIGALAASTHARGFVGGVTERLASGPAQLVVSVIYDDAHATTQRQSADMITLSGGYKLHGWTLDSEASTIIPLGSGFAARPHVGTTWVWTRRGGTVEGNASVFALTVAGDHHSAGFIDGGVRFAALQDAVGRLSPYLDLGVRYQLEGREAQAFAGFGGGPVALYSDGVRRGSTSAVIAGGANYRATDAVTLFVTGSGDLSHGNSSGAVTGGVRVLF
ncbi:MAG: hypothetical protein M3N34_01330 [Pseudomonadota bacterium]|nr:hypothetical protein [Pseudomonadota bacterium]